MTDTKVLAMQLLDIRHYTDRELSLLVFNTEHLYSYMIQGYDIVALVQDIYLYTDKQLSVLIQDIRQYEVEL